MKLFYFTSAKYGLENVAKRRIKISRISQLNDPFELLANCLSDKELRKAFRETKHALDTDKGIICFSERWSNPVMWSHYGDKHRGICLGFEVGSKLLMKVNYQRRRLPYTKNDFAPGNHSNKSAMHQCLITKFSHWRYEREWRLFLQLDHTTKDSCDNYFKEFEKNMRLTQIIVGSESEVTRSDVESSMATGKHAKQDVEHFKSRAAFRSFEIVRNRDSALWG